MARNQLTVPESTYDVTASAFGYQSSTVSNVEVISGTPQTVNFSLQIANWYTVTGVVSDVRTGWPLYGRISIGGYPGDPIWSDPQTGTYRISLPEDITYTFKVESFVTGYLAATEEIGPLTADQVVNFELEADPDACDAPGYETVGNVCQPQAGGLVIGNVYDANTAAALNGAQITNDGGFTTTALTTPADANVADGFYTLFSPAGSQGFDASLKNYATSSIVVTVVTSDTVRQDFTLDAGWLQVTPTGLDAVLNLGASVNAALSIENQGAATATFEVQENKGEFVPGKPLPGAQLHFKGGHFSPLRMGQFPSRADAPQEDSRKPLPIPNEPPWAGIANYPAPIMDNGMAAFDGKVYSVGGYDGTTTTAGGYVYDPAANTWSPIASMSNGREKPAAAFINGLLYVVGGWGSSGTPVTAVEIYNPAADSWGMGASIPIAFAGSSAAALNGKLYVIGGCDADTCGFSNVQVYDPTADTWSAAAPYPVAVSWNACSAISGKLYCAGGSYGDSELKAAYVYDPGSDSWSPIADLPITLWAMGYTAANGRLYVSGGVTNNFATVTNATYSYDPASDTWTADASANILSYRGGSACGFYRVGGSTGGFNPISNGEVYPGLDVCDVPPDVPWLSESPITGTIAGGAVQPVDVTFDASVPEVDQPGQYHALLRLANNTPYGPAAIPVTMTVITPPTWGKLTGNVTGLGYCDANPEPLEDAEVYLQSADGYTKTLLTDGSGAFQWWLDETHSPITLTVSAAQHAPGAISVDITAQVTATLNFDLRWLQPCIQVDPANLSQTLEHGATATQTLTVWNQGAASTEISLLEIPTRGRLITQAAAVAPQDGRKPLGNMGRSAPVYGGGGAPLVDEGFEGGVIPPDGWTQVINDPSYTWELYDLDPHTGLYAADVEYDDTLAQQDEWLLSPELSLSDGMLMFWSAGSVYWCRDDYDNCDLNVWLVVGEVGGGDDIFVGKGEDVWPENWTWAQSVFDLTPLLPGGPVRIGFQYYGLDGAQVMLDDVALYGTESVDVPWLSESPMTATLSADSSIPVVVAFDAGAVAQPGDYAANIQIASSDPVNGGVQVPVTLTVTAPLTWGRLEGTIFTQGYCDQNPAPLGGATVVIRGAAATYTTTTDLDGHYEWWLLATQSPLTVTALADFQTSVSVNGVNVTAQQTTTQAFALRWMEPCAAMSTDAITVSLTQGMSQTLPLTVTNGGPVTLTWTMLESPGLPVNGRTAPFPSLPSRTPVADPHSSNQIALPIELIQDGGFEAGAGGGFWNEFSTTFGTPICDIDACGTDVSHSGRAWVWFGDTTDYEQAYVNQNVVIPAAMTTLSFYLAMPTCDSGADYLNVQIDGSVLFNTTGASPLCGSGYRRYLVEVSDFADNQLHNVAFNFESFGVNGSISSFFIDDVSLMSESDLPWLSEQPISGTVSADSQDLTGLIFDASHTTPGTYQGSVLLRSDDPNRGVLALNVTLEVITPTYGVALSPDQSSSTLIGDTVTYTVRITNTGSAPNTFDISGSGDLGWSFDLSDTSVTLAAGESVAITVAVHVPPAAVDEQFHLIVEATGVNAAAQTRLTTTAVKYLVFMPLIYR